MMLLVSSAALSRANAAVVFISELSNRRQATHLPAVWDILLPLADTPDRRDQQLHSLKLVYSKQPVIGPSYIQYDVRGDLISKCCVVIALLV